jgi:hypothetical protein
LSFQPEVTLGILILLGKSFVVERRRFAMPKLNVNDIQIYHEVHGVGTPLVMIMGLGGNLDWWDPRMVQELSKRFMTVLFDNRGLDAPTCLTENIP